MIPRPFEQLDRNDLDALVANGISERRDLEFKRELPGTRPDDVQEFLADVTSLANAHGGDLIYGIEANKDGVAIGVHGLDVPSSDKALLRLESMLRDSIDPRLSGVRMEWIPLDATLGAIVIRVPASLAAPHRVRVGKGGPFYGRNSRGKYPMDAQELRIAFTQSEQLPQKIRQLHVDAITAASGHDMPFALNDEPAAVVSTIPLSFFREARDLGITHQNVQAPVEVSGGLSWIFTLEGVLMHTPLDDAGRVRSYALTHHAGRVDAAWTIGGVRDVQGKERRLVWPQRFERGLLDAAGSAVIRLKDHGIDGPWVVLTTIIGVRDFQMIVGDGYITRSAWRDNASFSELIVDTVNGTTLLPQLDSFWRLFGEHRPVDRAI